jgi:NAD-dependent dihydropyrimidine dehydrogenase PreA subunit
VLFGIGLLVLGVFVARPYCRFVCPYGVLLGWASRLSWRRVTITPDECVVCGLCESACPVDAILPATAERSAETRPQGIRGLVSALILLPFLLGFGFWAGGALGKPLVRWHEDALLAEQLVAEDAGAMETEITASFREGSRTREQLLEDVANRKARLSRGGRWVGAFLGLVVGLRLISLRIRWKRTGYEPDRAECVACARCYITCPQQRKREKPNGGG